MNQLSLVSDFINRFPEEAENTIDDLVNGEKEIRNARMSKIKEDEHRYRNYHWVFQRYSGLHSDHSRYIVTKFLGRGTAGTVVKAVDIQKREEVALKIFRLGVEYHEDGQTELDMLQRVSAITDCDHLKDYFEWKGRFCIASRVYGPNLSDFMKNNIGSYRVLDVRDIAQQLLAALEARHEQEIIHADLTTSNVVFQDEDIQLQIDRLASKKLRVALIDYGLALSPEETGDFLVTASYYRAPEVILGLRSWSYPIDLWSLGCVLVECWSGNVLFSAASDDYTHLALMEAVTGQEFSEALFNEKRWSKRYPSWKEFKKCREQNPQVQKLTKIVSSKSEYSELFLDLLGQLFVYDPQKRITAAKALEHGWFKSNAPPAESSCSQSRPARQKRKRLLSL